MCLVLHPLFAAQAQKYATVKKVELNKDFLKLDQRRAHKGFPTLWFAHSSRLVLTKLPAGREEKEEEGEEKEEQEEEEEGE